MKSIFERILSVSMLTFMFLPGFLMMTSGVGSRRDIENVYYHMKNGEMMIALTFDDGPNAKTTPQVLDVLKKHGVPGTFFAVGECVEANPELIVRELDEGHEVGNHTYSHLALKGNAIGSMEKEIGLTEDAIAGIANYRTRLFRPPEGLCSSKIAAVAADCGYKVILWNIDTRDWAHTGKADMVKNIMTNIESGDIILFHDGISGETHTSETLDEIIPKLKEQGYRFVTVSELLACG